MAGLALPPRFNPYQTDTMGARRAPRGVDPSTVASYHGGGFQQPITHVFQNPGTNVYTDGPTGATPYGGGAGAGAGASGGGRSGVDPQRRADFMGLANEIRGGPITPAMSPTPVARGDVDPYDKGAEDAAFGRAKDRTGQTLQAALRGLRTAMSARGLSGTPIEGERMSGLFEAGMGQLGEHDRTYAEGTARRAFDAGQTQTDRDETGRRFNLGFQQSEAARVQEAQARKLASLLSVYQSMY